MYLELDRLSKQFDGKYAVHDLSLGLEEGGLLCILGSSGCGKTTTLNMIGGFLKPNGGRVLLDGQDITALPPERRPVSTVFQSYGLFPHMSVLQNVTYGLKFRGYSRTEAKEKGRHTWVAAPLARPEAVGRVLFFLRLRLTPARPAAARTYSPRGCTSPRAGPPKWPHSTKACRAWSWQGCCGPP